MGLVSTEDITGGIKDVADIAMGAIAMNRGNKKNKQALAMQERHFREMMDYNKWVLQTTREREDNAIQRQAADMKLAGINPLMAAGLGGASSGGGIMSMPSAIDYIGAASADNANMLGGISAIQRALEIAQGDKKVKNETEKTKSDIDKNSSDISKNLSDIKTADVQRKLAEKGIQETDAKIDLILEQAKKTANECNEIDQKIAESKVRMQNIQSETMKNNYEAEIKRWQKEKEKIIGRAYQKANELADKGEEILNTIIEQSKDGPSIKEVVKKHTYGDKKSYKELTPEQKLTGVAGMY